MKSSIHTNVVVNLIRTIAMTLLSFVTFPLVCRILGDAQLGTFSWASSFIYYFIVLSKVSIPNIAVRECSKVKNDPEKLSMKIQEFFIMQSITTLLSFGVMCVLVFSIPSLHEQDNQSIIFLLSLNFLSSVFAFEWVFQALEKHTYLAIRSIIILAFVDILIFSLIRYKEWLPLYTFLTTLVTIFTVISNLIYLPSLVKFKKTEPYNFKQYLPTIGILFMISLAVAIYNKTDSFILGFIDDGKSSVGAYSVGMKGVDIVIGIITALSTVFMPRASYYLSKNDENKFAKLNNYSSNIAFIIVLPAIALMATLATPITKLIAGENGYANANEVLIVLSSLMITFAMSNIIYTQILIPRKREKIYLLALSIGAVTNILLSLLFGLVIFKDKPAVGVALATSITDLLIFIALFAFTYKDSRKMIFNFNNLKIVLISIILGLFSYFGGNLIYDKVSEIMASETAMLVQIGSVFLISVIIYVTLLIFTKEKLTRSVLHRH